MCMIIRALSFISKKFDQQHIIKVMNKLEGLLYMQVPNASKNDIIEIIKNIARIFNGGGKLFWMSMDQ
jgi:N-acetylmuramic acid 6-phosphate (MurNAc-6-P) etherase